MIKDHYGSNQSRGSAGVAGINSHAKITALNAACSFKIIYFFNSIIVHLFIGIDLYSANTQCIRLKQQVSGF